MSGDAFLFRLICIFILVTFTNIVHAGQELDKTAVQLSVSAGNVSAQRQLIESKIVQIEYQEMLSTDRVILLSKLEAIDSGAVTGNTVVLYQDNINQILQKSFEDSRLICSHEKPTGSKRSIRTCTTAAAKERKHQETQYKTNTMGTSLHTPNQ